ncbi:MAG: sulfurtransferase TusA family protein [Candidatus Eisenbacteria sp.]|jgi:TusA-related sulfurtransferase|nr:sulfurtransferase TusA family protein [Candidatus Eisenbacteria bacterium]
MGDKSEESIAETLDMTGYFCPEPVIRVNEAIGDVGVGEVLELLADDPSSKPDIQSWTKRTGHELISIEEDGGVFRFLLRRTA